MLRSFSSCPTSLRYVSWYICPGIWSDSFFLINEHFFPLRFRRRTTVWKFSRHVCLCGNVRPTRSKYNSPDIFSNSPDIEKENIFHVTSLIQSANDILQQTSQRWGKLSCWHCWHRRYRDVKDVYTISCQHRCIIVLISSISSTSWFMKWMGILAYFACS